MMAWIKSISLLLLFLSAATVSGHDSRPLFVELKEIQAGIFRLQWKIPPSVDMTNLPAVGMPEACQLQGEVAQSVSGGGTVRSASYVCEELLSGEGLHIRYPQANPSLSTLVRYYGADGQEHTSVMSPAEKSWSLPGAETPSRVVSHYTRLGIEHIWAGVDHLLFLVCLLWIAGTGKRIFITVTGFTLAHSLTLGLSTLGLVNVPVAPVEASIALSIVFLAMEMARGPSASLTWRHPIAVASSFGLLHGFGFANVLYEVGLPQTEIPLALLFFNVGVEIGQMVFVVTVIVLGVIARSIVGRHADLLGMVRWKPHAQTTAIYVVGSLAAFWLVERTVGFV